MTRSIPSGGRSPASWMPMVRIPSRLAVRAMRTAISPRLAMSTEWMGDAAAPVPVPAGGADATRANDERDTRIRPPTRSAGSRPSLIQRWTVRTVTPSCSATWRGVRSSSVTSRLSHRSGTNGWWHTTPLSGGLGLPRRRRIGIMVGLRPASASAAVREPRIPEQCVVLCPDLGGPHASFGESPSPVPAHRVRDVADRHARRRQRSAVRQSVGANQQWIRDRSPSRVAPDDRPRLRPHPRQGHRPARGGRCGHRRHRSLHGRLQRRHARVPAAAIPGHRGLRRQHQRQRRARWQHHLARQQLRPRPGLQDQAGQGRHERERIGQVNRQQARPAGTGQAARG